MKGGVQIEWIRSHTLCIIPQVLTTVTFSFHDYSMLTSRERYLVNQKLEVGLHWSLWHICYDVRDLQSLFLSTPNWWELDQGSEKAMAPHSSNLAWKIPWMEEPGGLQSMGSQRVGHDWATSLSLFTFMHWRRKWQPTPVFLPGESQGRGSLVGCCLWGRTESDTTEVT